MNRIDTIFKKLKEKKEKAFVSYISAGDPDISVTLTVMELFAEKGVDIIELGVPFSDPIGDGPVNQAGAERGLLSGTNLKKILELSKKFRAKNENTALVLFSYFNPLLQYGTDKIAVQCKQNGIDALLTVDSPFDMNFKINSLLKKNGLHSINLIAPTTEERRMREIVKHSGGFIYYVSSLGVTGMRKKLDADISGRIGQIRKLTNLPVCVGFGISDPETALKVSRFADGVVVGSAFVKIIEELGKKPERMLSRLSDFTEAMIKAVKEGSF